MRTTRIITVLLAALLTAAILAGPAAAVPTDVISGGSTSPDQGPVVERTVASRASTGARPASGPRARSERSQSSSPARPACAAGESRGSGPSPHTDHHARGPGATQPHRDRPPPSTKASKTPRRPQGVSVSKPRRTGLARNDEHERSSRLLLHRRGCRVNGSEKLREPERWETRRRFAALVKVSSHLVAMDAAALSMGRPITDRHTGSEVDLCDSL